MILEDDLPRGDGDPDFHGYPGQVRYIGIDKVIVNRTTDPIADWIGHPSNQYELGDQMADHSDDQGWDIEEELGDVRL